MTPPAELSRGWRTFFRLELPLCLVTVSYWLVAPEHFLRGLVGPFAFDVAHRYLLLQAAATVTSFLLWFYGRVLFSPRIHLPTFRLLQEAMALGDVGVLAISGYLAFAARPTPSILAGQIALAAFFGGARVVFLVRTRGA